MERRKAVRFTAFVDRVGRRIGPPPPDKLGGAMIASARPGEAERAILATLEVLGECLCGEEAEALAARLPGELREALTSPRPNAGYFSLRQFHRRVAEKEGTSPGVAARHAEAVMEVVAEAASEEGLRYVRPLLPEGLVEFPPAARQARAARNGDETER